MKHIFLFCSIILFFSSTVISQQKKITEEQKGFRNPDNGIQRVNDKKISVSLFTKRKSADSVIKALKTDLNTNQANWEQEKLVQQNNFNSLKPKYEIQKNSPALSILAGLFLLGCFGLALIFAVILFILNRRINSQKKQIKSFNIILEKKVSDRTAELSRANAELIQKNQDIEDAFFKGQVIERKRVSADLHDEIGSALSTIGIFSDLAKRKARKSAPELVNELERIGVKSREMVQTMRDTIWTISENSSQNVWERMQQYGTEILVAKDISFSWQTSFNEQDKHIPFLIRRNLFLAFKEALNNIMKHSDATAVCINISCEEQLVIEIMDNGRGFNPEAIAEKGNGIRNFNDRMQEIGGKVTIESEIGTGTKLILTINTNL